MKGKVTGELEVKEWDGLPVARILEKNNTFGDTPGIRSKKQKNKKTSRYFHTLRRTKLSGLLQMII